MIYEDCHYDTGKSRELVNMKIHVSLDEICLSYTCSVSQSATYTYHIINTGTSCYNFSLRIKKPSVQVVTAMFRFYWKLFWISGSHPRTEKKTAETDYFLHQCFNSTCMIYSTLQLVRDVLFLRETIYMVSAAVNQIELFKFDRQVALCIIFKILF